jgi:hypothetical protein
VQNFSYVLSHGVFSTFEIPNADFVATAGINDKGDVVGGYALPTSQARGFLLTR